jgi:hypothetical protein
VLYALNYAIIPRDLWDRVVTVLPGKPMYGRIDTVTIDGRPHVMELELIEPSLLRHEPKAADLSADAIVQRIDSDKVRVVK